MPNEERARAVSSAEARAEPPVLQRASPKPPTPILSRVVETAEALRPAVAPPAPVAVAPPPAPGLAVVSRLPAVDQALPDDPVQKAALLGDRLACAAQALASGAPPGAASVDELLATVDGCLTQLKQLAKEATPEARPALDEARTALLDQAFAFTTTLQSTLPGAPVAAEAPVGKPAAVGSITFDLGPAEGAGRASAQRRPALIIGALVVSVLIAAAYHGHRLLVSPPAPGSYAGAPKGMVLGAGSGAPAKVLIVAPGATPDPQELARFRAQEEAKGHTVQETAPGVFAVTPSLEELTRKKVKGSP